MANCIDSVSVGGTGNALSFGAGLNFVQGGTGDTVHLTGVGGEQWRVEAATPTAIIG